jgi:cell division protein FtsI (penicillin-binding protein 3)
MLDKKKNNLELFGDFKERIITAKLRFSFVLFFLFFGYFLITLKIINLSISHSKELSNKVFKVFKQNQLITGLRADIIDRNGVQLATSHIQHDLVANPKEITKNKKELSKKISNILPELTYEDVLKKLESEKSFVYLKRPISPKKLNKVVKLGEPGIKKKERYVRYYPHQKHASHILGGVNIDNKGIKGIESTFDKKLRDPEFIKKGKLQLSIDINLQKNLDFHLSETINRHSAEGGAGIILDVKTAEILAMNSLPQFNPNKINKMDKKAEFNNATLGVFELGSLFKSLSGAIALDKKILTEDTIYDARKPLKEGKFTIHDYKPKKRKLKFSECVLYSSNICFAQVGTDIGEKNMKEYFEKLQLTNKPEIELPEVGEPILPTVWRKTDLMAMSYGHTIAVSPLQFVNAFNAIINGGKFQYSTLIKKENYENNFSTEVISENTSKRIRKLLREVVRSNEGSGKSANIKGFSIAGKTGTAIKNKKNRSGYKDENRTSFVGFFPSYDPKYIVFIMVDNPKRIKENFNYATAGWVAAPTVKKIINEMIPRLGIEPEIDKENELLQQFNLSKKN